MRSSYTYDVAGSPPYTPGINTSVDYYAFGMQMPGRTYNGSSYRFGYNQGSEKDDEITGVSGSHFTTYFREGDTRIARWWSVDPKANLQPANSPYSLMDGNPILITDKMGDVVEVTFSGDNYAEQKQNFESQLNGYLEGQFKVVLTPVNSDDVTRYVVTIVPEKNGQYSKLSGEGKRFKETFAGAIKAKNTAKIAYEKDAADVSGDQWETGRVDFGDLQAYDESKSGKSGRAGLIHAIFEQLQKDKMGLKPGEMGKEGSKGGYADQDSDYGKAHYGSAQAAEEYVGGYKRAGDTYTFPGGKQSKIEPKSDDKKSGRDKIVKTDNK